MLHSRSSWGCADGRCVCRPHLSFYFPQEFGALYPPAEQIAPPAHPNPPTGMPLAAWHEGNFNNKWGKPCNDTRPFRRAYYSAVSFTDDNIGKLLAQVDTLGLKQNTLVAIMGDHVRRKTTTCAPFLRCVALCCACLSELTGCVR